jgi:hypothetical protein
LRNQHLLLTLLLLTPMPLLLLLLLRSLPRKRPSRYIFYPVPYYRAIVLSSIHRRKLRLRRKTDPRARVFFLNSLLPSRTRSQRDPNPPRRRRKRKRLKPLRRPLQKLPRRKTLLRMPANPLRMLVSPLLRQPKRMMHPHLLLTP